ncbi:hypothetical protein QRX50_35125 [Amycolatopsis carbonis]|uniref:Uncharacterized protein n=1 Tax=Amycolatopsis carbonis TaxID=715471 RepID=A0A9Y2IBV0_9PSEU|nr:hypothetical protein [Amycolatopsis sp. 2-15]WIX76654.1 hypothetical protein QRX50_35125 [Amycolatopsis sp. 2-15]
MSGVAHADGGPRHEFMGSANQGYRILGGTNEGPTHLGTIAAAVIRLAYNTPRTEYTVRLTTEPMSRLSPWKVNAVTKPELAVKISQLVAKSSSLPIGDVRIALLGNGNVGFAQRPSDGPEIVSFTITEEKDADA